MRKTRIETVLRFASQCPAVVVLMLPVAGCTSQSVIDVPADFQSFFETLLTFASDLLRQIAAAWLF